MHCIPPEPDFSDLQLAEKAVWERVRAALPEDATLAHSVQVRHGRAEHEIDLLVLWPGVGLAAIEVKGGLIRVKHGQWHQSGGIEGYRRIQSPVAQSQGALHAFRSWIGDQLGTPLTSRFAYMVALPYTEVDPEWSMAGCPRALILDKYDLDAGVETWIRSAIEDEGSGASPLASSYMGRITRRLEGTFEDEGGPDGHPVDLEDWQDQLTEKQSALLSATRSLTHVRFVGGAGSGKTWLAVEKARRLAKEGKRVGLFCYNKGLGQYLQSRVANWRQAKPVFTGEFHEYAKSLGVRDGTGQSYFEEEMPHMLSELAQELPHDQRLDALVVDEAQDFAPLWWDSLLSCLRDGDAGEIYTFMDNNQDVYRRWDNGITRAKGHPVAGLVPIHVDDNLRNTRRIAETFKVFAGDHFTPRINTGLPVRRVECPTENALEAASDCIDALIAEGWAANQIALLTTKNRHPIHQEYFEQDATDEYWRQFHSNDAEFYGHVLGFKGLERSVIVLCIDGFKDLERAPEQLYVGLSRARSLLVVVGESEMLKQAGGNQLELELSKARVWDPAKVDAKT